ncbi:MAG TPA: arylamine N-acetyltransferase [Nevskiaceae bacterium]|nr:arylamine N-acetyltransferase [Nevskiaceae bacterium]
MTTLDPALRERILEKLGLRAAPALTLEGLTAVYGAWCQGVPFDNVRKLIHLRRDDPGELPGTRATDFFEAWLRHGTGGTCWAGHGALHALLASLGFDTQRGVGTMLVAPDIPPNHGTVVVRFGDESWIVDASILHGQPLPISRAESAIDHGAWGVRFRHAPGERPIIRWRPLHLPEGFDCRIEQVGVPERVFVESHEGTRAWSPFNYQLYIRANRGDRVVGIAMGQRVELDAAGNVSQREIGPHERTRILVEEIGLSEEIAAAVPADVPMPPPPASVKGPRS